METSNQETIFGWPNTHVDALIKQVGSPVSTVKALANDIVATGQVRPTSGTRIYAGAVEIDHGIVEALSISGPGTDPGVVKDLAGRHAETRGLA